MSKIPGAVFPRRLDRRLPQAKASQGAWIQGDDGKRYLDASGGAVVVNVGHSRPEIADAVHQALLDHSFLHGTMFTSRPTEGLATALAELAPGDIGRFYFMTSGSEAVEAALKLARQIQIARGEERRHLFISRWKAYHGLSMGALGVNTRPAFRKPFYPMFRDAVHIAPAYCLRCSFGLSYPGCGLRCALALDETIQNLGPEAVCAFIAEPVGGASLGAYAPPEGYWPLIREICGRHGVLLIMDEVMTGMGRTGKWFAAEHFGVTPDLITMGKGLSGGALPLSAVGTSSANMELVADKCGNFAHGGTYSHHAATCAAGLATVELIKREGLIERAAVMGELLGQKLRQHLADSPRVGDIRGLGMMWGVEFVKDKETLTPFPRSEKLAERLWDRLFSKGIITYKNIGMAGLDGDGLMVTPPFVITEDEIEFCARSMREALEETCE
jgi:adenosylmethionine-8-amino-7-oxononanoate aminotransferase